MAGMMMKMGTSAIKTQLEKKSMDIDWEDYNYPPGLKIMHFKPSELEDKSKIMVAHCMHVAFIGIPIFYLFNLSINLAGIFMKIEGASFYHALYSIFHFMIGVPLAMGVFSKGYRSLAGISDERTWYKFGEGFMIIFVLLAFFFEMLCYHGLQDVLRMRKENGVIFIFGLIEQSILLIEFGCRLYAILMVLMKYQPPETDN